MSSSALVDPGRPIHLHIMPSRRVLGWPRNRARARSLPQVRLLRNNLGLLANNLSWSQPPQERARFGPVEGQRKPAA